MTRGEWKKIATCRRKIRHKYFTEATVELLRMKRVLNGGDFLHIYHCRVCKGWHTGNSITLEGAKGSLKALEKRVARSIRRQVPPHIQTQWNDRRLNLIRYILQKEK